MEGQLEQVAPRRCSTAAALSGGWVRSQPRSSSCAPRVQFQCRGAQQLLRGWDLTQPADSAPAAYFNVVWSNLLELTFHDDLREGNWPDGGDRWFVVVGEMLREAGRPVVGRRRHRCGRDPRRHPRPGDGRRPRRADATAGPQPAELDLGAHAPDGPPLQHPRRVRRRADRGLFNRDGWEVGGGSSIVDATAWDAVEGTRDGDPVDADGREHGRPRRLPVDEPDRRLRATRSSSTTPTRRL